jgi:uncharacterized membrane protein YidH (DUF202 family)
VTDLPDVPAADEDVERTDLAWDRSVLAIGVLGLLLLRRLAPLTRARPAEGFVLLAMAGGFALVGAGYRRQRRHRPRASRSALKLVSAATAVVGVAAAVLAFAPR